MRRGPRRFGPFASGQQHAVHTLLRARTWVQVIAEEFVQVGFFVAAVVDHHLATVEVGMPEAWRHVDDGFVVEVGALGLDLIQGDDALQHRQAEGEEARVGRRDGQGVDRLVGQTGLEEEAGDRLAAQPFEGFLANTGEFLTEATFKGRLVGDAGIGNHHTVWDRGGASLGQYSWQRCHYHCVRDRP